MQNTWTALTHIRKFPLPRCLICACNSWCSWLICCLFLVVLPQVSARSLIIPTLFATFASLMYFPHRPCCCPYQFPCIIRLFGFLHLEIRRGTSNDSKEVSSYEKLEPEGAWTLLRFPCSSSSFQQTLDELKKGDESVRFPSNSLTKTAIGNQHIKNGSFLHLGEAIFNRLLHVILFLEIHRWIERHQEISRERWKGTYMSNSCPLTL